MDHKETWKITDNSITVASKLTLNKFFEDFIVYDEGRIEKFKTIYPNVQINKWHLFQPNIAMLNWLVVNRKQCAGIIDVGCGLGNFFGYLTHYFPGVIMEGVDDFSQIQSKTIEKIKNLCMVSKLRKVGQHNMSNSSAFRGTFARHQEKN